MKSVLMSQKYGAVKGLSTFSKSVKGIYSINITVLQYQALEHAEKCKKFYLMPPQKGRQTRQVCS